MISIADDSSLTAAQMSEELIFLIATASTDAQRKRAADLFRCFARQLEAEAFQRGRASSSSAASVPITAESAAVADVASAPPAATLPPDHRVSLIPLVSWQD